MINVFESKKEIKEEIKEEKLENKPAGEVLVNLGEQTSGKLVGQEIGVSSVNHSDIKPVIKGQAQQDQAIGEESFMHFSHPNDQALDRLVKAVDKAYNRPGLLMWRGFCYGFMTALGATVGTAVIIVVSSYAFAFFGGLRYLQNSINDFTSSITSTISNNN